MTILYDVVSLLRVFPSIGANLEPYSKKKMEKDHNAGVKPYPLDWAPN